MTLGEIVFGGSLWLAVPIALLAGLVSFASPCVLPLVPGYLGLVGGVTANPASADRRSRVRAVGRAVGGAALFVAGFTVVFVALGIVFGGVGLALKPYLDPLTRVAGALLIVLGLVFMGLFPRLQRSARVNWQPRVGLWGAVLMGLVFGLGWTPCIGPALAAILSLSLDSASPTRGAILGLVYCLGLGLPFLALAAGFQWASVSTSFLRRHVRAINIAGGIVLILIGVLMVTGLWTVLLADLQAVIVGYVPSV